MQNQPIDTPEMPPPGPYKKIGRVVGINLAILLGVAAILFIPSLGDNHGQYGGLGFMIGLMFLIPAQALVNLVVAIVYFAKNNPENGKAFLLAMLAVAVVGTSACFGGGMVF